MAESFANSFNNTFGTNIRVPEKTLQQIGKTGSNVAGGVFEPLFTYLEENENIFSGDVTSELNKIRAASFNTTMIMQEADIKVNGQKPKFDVSF